MTRSFQRLLFSSMVLLALVFPVTSSVATGSARSASSDANYQTSTTPSQADVPIKGWPARGTMLRMVCPGVSVCYAVGSLPQSDPLPTKPPTSPPGAIIARTEDGGQTWAYHVDPHSVFGSIACPSPTQCYVTAAHPHVRTVDQHHQIVTWTVGISATRDGGETWREHTLPNSGDTNADLACPTITVCVVWGGPTSLNSPRATVFITRDGGTNWKASQVMTHRQTSVARLVCPGVQSCYLYGGIQGTAISESQDTGRTWRVLPRSDMFALSGVPSRSLAHLGGISCPSARICYTAQGEPRCQCDAWAPYGTIVGTTDGGQHWRLLYRAHGKDYPEGTITCPTVSVCYAVASARRDVPTDQMILATKDGGRNWTSHRLPVVGVSCASADVCYAFSHAGGVFRTADGGTTWQPLP